MQTLVEDGLLPGWSEMSGRPTESLEQGIANSQRMVTMPESTWPMRGARVEPYAFAPDIKREIASLRPDNLTGVLYLLKDYAVMTGAAWLTLTVSWWLYPLAVVVIGAHQRGLTTIAHDAAHRTLARNPSINYLVGVVFAAYPIFQRHFAYRVSHVHKHHRFLGDPGKDPDLRFFIESGVYKVCHPFRYVLRIVVLPILGGATIRYLRYLWTNRFAFDTSQYSNQDRDALRADRVGFFAFWLVVTLCAFALGGVDELVLFWIVPYLTSFQILGWFIEIAEHNPMCETRSSNVHLTRNRKGPLVERMLFGVNLDEYHLEHHLSPGVPFWLLRRAQAIRLRDPGYRRIGASWGGLFARGPTGQRSVIGQLMDRNRQLYERREIDPGGPASVERNGGRNLVSR